MPDRYAQEYADEECLQLALGWLARFDEGPASLEITQLLLEGTRGLETPKGREVHARTHTLHWITDL